MNSNNTIIPPPTELIRFIPMKKKEVMRKIVNKTKKIALKVAMLLFISLKEGLICQILR